VVASYQLDQFLLRSRLSEVADTEAQRDGRDALVIRDRLFDVEAAGQSGDTLS